MLCWRPGAWGPCATLAPPSLSLGKAATDEDPAQGVVHTAHGDRRAHVQVAKGVEAGSARKQDLPGHVAKIRTLGEDQRDPAPRRRGQVGQEETTLGRLQGFHMYRSCTLRLLRWWHGNALQPEATLPRPRAPDVESPYLHVRQLPA